MKRIHSRLGSYLSRRGFLRWASGAFSALGWFWLTGCGRAKNAMQHSPASPVQPAVDSSSTRSPSTGVYDASPDRTLLKNGLIVDGTGRSAFEGDLLITGTRIEEVTPCRIQYTGRCLDCTGKVVAPGFIDMHSHMDWVLPIPGHPELKMPFTAQGVTTFVGGNCGFGIAGVMPDSPHQNLIFSRTFGLYPVQWHTMADYFEHLRRLGVTHNLANLAGHGTTRASIRGFNPSPLSDSEMKLQLHLLEEAMDQGAYGVSLGLQYEPGVFATMEELERVAALVKRKDKILTVHMKAYSSLSGTYPLRLFGRPHNLLAIEDMLELARKTGVRLQLSHLIFVGQRTWKNYENALAMIEQARREGLDVQFDTYAFHCGTSIINVFLPEWFLARVPDAFESRGDLFKLYAQIELIRDLLGFGYDDIQVTDAGHPELNRYNGLFLPEIAAQRRLPPFENFIDIVRKSNGRARVLNHRYSNLEIVNALMQHPAALYMTDATIFPAGVQNPAAYGNFPRFLQYARNHRPVTMEEAIRKMTGASAERFRIKNRGCLRQHYNADVTVFDWEKVRDNTTLQHTDRAPDGIEAVFINGRQVLAAGKATPSLLPGRVL